MGKFRFDTTVLWERGKESAKQGNIPIEYFAAGDGLNVSPAERSDMATDLTQLLFVEEVIGQQQMFSILLPVVHAGQFIRPNWELVGIRLGMYEGKRHVRSVEAAWPTRKFSVANKGLQRMTFKFPGDLVQYVP